MSSSDDARPPARIELTLDEALDLLADLEDAGTRWATPAISPSWSRSKERSGSSAVDSASLTRSEATMTAQLLTASEAARRLGVPARALVRRSASAGSATSWWTVSLTSPPTWLMSTWPRPRKTSDKRSRGQTHFCHGSVRDRTICAPPDVCSTVTERWICTSGFNSNATSTRIRHSLPLSRAITGVDLGHDHRRGRRPTATPHPGRVCRVVPAPEEHSRLGHGRPAWRARITSPRRMSSRRPRKSGSGGACHSPGRSKPNRPRTTPNPRTTT